jgi:hypothetical protein
MNSVAAPAPRRGETPALAAAATRAETERIACSWDAVGGLRTGATSSHVMFQPSGWPLPEIKAFSISASSLGVVEPLRTPIHDIDEQNEYSVLKSQ